MRLSQQSSIKIVQKSTRDAWYSPERQRKKKRTKRGEAETNRRISRISSGDYHRSISFPFFPFLRRRASNAILRLNGEGRQGRKRSHRVINRVNEKLLGKFAERKNETEAIKHRECTEKRYGMIKTGRTRAFASERIEYALKVQPISNNVRILCKLKFIVEIYIK